MNFLKEWDKIIAQAQIQGKPGRLWSFQRTKADPFPMGQLVARTMHPSFMAGVVVKHDPERDQ